MNKSLRWLFVVAAAVPGALYWILDALLRPEEPFSVAVIFRYGDLQMLPQIAAVGSGSIVASSVVDSPEASYLIGGQLLGFLYYGLFWRISELAGFLGGRGLVLADVLLSIGTYLVFKKLFLKFEVDELFASAIALFVVAGGIGLTDYFFSPRWPRPHLTTPLLVGGVTALFVYLKGKDFAFPLGVFSVLGGAMCGDIYSAFTLAVVFSFAVLTRRPRMKWFLLSLFLAAIVLSLIWLHNSELHTDTFTRMGIFKTDWPVPLFQLPHWYSLVITTFTVVVLFVGLYLSRRNRVRLVWMLSLCIVSFLALPLWSLLFGVVTQIYHFLTSHIFYCTLTLLVVAGLTASFYLSKLQRGSRYILIATLLLLGFARGYVDTARQVIAESPMRPDFYGEGEYRPQFVELTNLLAGYPSESVLGTLDHQVSSWWLAFGGGHVLVPDSFYWSGSQQQAEARLLQYVGYFGDDEYTFTQFIERRDLLPFWLGHAMYQASGAYTFSAAQFYEAKAIDPSIYASWNVVLPNDEIERLRGRFIASVGREPFRAPDVIVVNRMMMPELRAPSGFTKRFENEVFWVYERLGG